MLTIITACALLVCAAVQYSAPVASAAPVAATVESDVPRVGAYRVRTIGRFEIPRDGRDALRCTIRTPIVALERSDRFPLVIFSHGMGGSSDAFGELSQLWASHGYVVIHPTHADSLSLRREAGENGLDEVRDLAGNPRAYTRNVDPLGRVSEVRLILDRLDDIEAALEELRDADGVGRIDRERIGVAGHSAGAMTAQLCCGVRARLRDRDSNERLRDVMPLRDFGDARIKAGVIISGQGTTSRLFTDESWRKVRVPMLVISGSRDTSRASDETPASRRHPFEKSPGRGAGGQAAYLMFIDGATHSSYQGKNKLARLLGEQIDEEELRTIGDVTALGTLLFLDAHLKGDEAARGTLGEPDAGVNPFEAIAPGKVEYLVK